MRCRHGDAHETSRQHWLCQSVVKTLVQGPIPVEWRGSQLLCTCRRAGWWGARAVACQTCSYSISRDNACIVLVVSIQQTEVVPQSHLRVPAAAQGQSSLQIAGTQTQSCPG